MKTGVLFCKLHRLPKADRKIILRHITLPKVFCTNPQTFVKYKKFNASECSLKGSLTDFRRLWTPKNTD
jgi:hypothetical protein